MKKTLIITSHYPPSNLTAVHRVRSFANNLPKFGWNPIVLTVKEKYYEEKADHELLALIPDGQRIEKVNAFRVTRPRLIGDLGLRGFFQLLRRTSSIIKEEKIDFIYIFIPSFYLALIGKIIFLRYSVKYGIDYIDPWVHTFPGSEKLFSRHWFSTQIARILEPWAVSDATLITGVASSYFTPVLKRNQNLSNKLKTYAMPYGWDRTESAIVNRLDKQAYLFKDKSKIKLIYAGAYLPKSKYFLESLFKVIASNPSIFSNVCFYFIGTGKSIHSNFVTYISNLASEFGVSNYVIECPERYSYFDVLIHIRDSDGVFILGSTERHYTPSKLFNAILMRKPVFALLHQASSINEVIRSSDWGSIVEWNEQLSSESFSVNIQDKFKEWKLNTMNLKWSFREEAVNPLAVDELLRPLANLLHSLND